MTASVQSIIAEMDTIIAAERRYAALRDLLESRIQQARVLRRDLWRRHGECLLSAAREALGDNDETSFMVGDTEVSARRAPQKLEVMDAAVAEQYARQQPHLSGLCISAGRFQPTSYLNRAEETYRLSGRLLPGIARVEEHVQLFVNGVRVDDMNLETEATDATQ